MGGKTVCPDVLASIISEARAIVDTDKKLDTNHCRTTVLFPFLEALGYQSDNIGDIVICPLYSPDGSYKLNYGLCGTIKESVRVVIKVVDYESAPDKELDNIRSCLTAAPEAVQPDYLMVTDCFTYHIYDVKCSTGAILFMTKFDLLNVDSAALQMMSLLCNPASAAKQKFAVDRTDDTEFPAVADIAVSEDGPSVPETVEQPDEKRTYPLVIPILVGVVCFALVVAGIVCGFMRRWDTSLWYSVTVNHNPQRLQYSELVGHTSATVYGDGKIQVSVTDTNLVKDTALILTLTNQRTNESKSYAVQTGADGGVTANLTVPSGWQDCTVSVHVELSFTQTQPPAILEKFGRYGESIVGSQIYKTGYLLGSASVRYQHNNHTQTVETTPDGDKTRILDDFTVVKYSNGDIGIYPKGYDTNDWGDGNQNITSTNKSYAELIWDASEKKALFFYVVGTHMQQASVLPTAGAYILSDGLNTYKLNVPNGTWKWGGNDYRSLVGWTRFDPDGVANLCVILRSIYASQKPTLEFKNLNEKVYLSSDDINAVMSILTLYETYFQNCTGIPVPIAEMQ